ncbi:30S ribosomal protein S12 methylthiotransferase RimO [Tissierella sp. MSJ-40]|uniref:Ribosomal protein uS12 methylthiotransferase RimO n=1 Tax=Tissierella simiarum TaxID=2841534 RepID=A0ABS6E530_9FIRM|nr:30S ribosomal protein S12 methylthiotransferase RimO [Tissierella simiarum]MBU5437646.1 30S ribosomal protein S12 methylthiotransferase RimO [Tissierella simiarum]
MNFKKVSIVTLGCSKNEIDSELMTSLLKGSDYEIVSNLEEAEIIIVNTCGFIDMAKEESIETIWEMTKYKEEGDCKYLILSGCLAERYSKELMEEIEEVDGIIGTGNVKEIVNVIKKLEKEKITKVGNVDVDYLEEVKRINFSKTAYVKISEGCNNFCTYCIIPKLRGKYRSRKIEDIVREVEYLVSNGVEEIILIGQNTSDYGIDLYNRYNLNELLDRLNLVEDLKWIRILYLYPDNFSNELISAIRDNDKVLKYVDIPLQHINNEILKRMNRKTSKEDIVLLIKRLREEIPEIVIRTTFIVGFPGETEEEFKELYDFVSQVKFDRLGVFTYSQEEDTPAYKLPNQIEEYIKIQRRDKIMEIQKDISEDLMSKNVGELYEVLIEEEVGDNVYIGRSYMDSPEIDGVVYVTANNKLELGSFVKVKITDYLEYDLIGEMDYEFGQ